MLRKYIGVVSLLSATVLLASCQGDGEFTGREYAPQMYHSVSYEPLSQIVKEDVEGDMYYIPNSTPYNDYNGSQPMNMRKPVDGTIARQNYVSATKNQSGIEQPLMIYDLHKDSLAAAALLKNPIPASEAVLSDGKALYLSYCGHCHGEKGDGKGKVGEIYTGVPSYTSKATAALPEGHVFHVITNGIRRMWAHKSQLSPEERWKIVHYVQKLQKGEQ